MTLCKSGVDLLPIVTDRHMFVSLSQCNPIQICIVYLNGFVLVVVDMEFDMKVTVIGLGNMGSGIAGNVQRAGYELSVWNRTPSKMESFVHEGALGCSTIQDAVNDADIVITSLMDDESILHATEGEGGMISALKPGAIHACTTTISPDCANRLADIHKTHGSYYVSACVVGRPDAAEAGTLLTLLAGDKEIIEQTAEVCEAFSENIMKLPGKPSQANIMKLSINYTAISIIELMSEVYTFCEKAGLDLKYMSNFYTNILNHPALKMYASKLVDRSFDDGGFAMSGGRKDVGLMLAASESEGVDFAIARIIRDKMDDAIDSGMETMDWSAIHEITRERAGME
jgi:3-hydroxyisobutyrate dehydrogenase-like beta-hydroxyacid dehydrogenase